MLKLTIHRADAPSYRAAVLDLPEREDLLAEKLEQIGVGPTLEKNCQITKLEGDGGALQPLVGACVNADEMQYLAKRMDSFDTKELLTFRAAVTVEKPTAVKDLINLTFNLHCYTVITDFSDVAGIGRNHLLSKRIALSGNELAATDCEAIGRALISGGDGVVTPYGVLYRNGNEPELVYNGRQFPEYFYQECEAALVLSTDKDFKVSETLYFPCFEVEVKKAFLRLGADASECFSSVQFHRLCEPLGEMFEKEVDPAQYVDELNELARCYRGFDAQAEKNYQAIMEYISPADPLEALLMAQNYWEFTVIPGIHTPEEYGRHMIEESGRFDFDPNLADHVNFHSYGQQRVQVFKVHLYTSKVGDTMPGPYRLVLPACEERLEQVKKLIGVDDFAQARMEQVEYPLTCLQEYLPTTDCPSVETLNALAGEIEELLATDGKLLKLCGVLEAEQPQTLDEALRITKALDDYERIPCGYQPDEYGRYVMKHAEQLEIDLLEDLEGFVDEEAYGKYRMREDGVRVTGCGLIRRLSEPFPTQESGMALRQV